MEPVDSTGLFAWIKSKLKDTALEGAVNRLGMPRSALRNFESFARLSGKAASGLPTELLGLAANMWSGFVLTPFTEQQMGGWVFPYWLDRQRSPSSGSFIPHGHFWLECNMTHRNWTGIGLCGFPNEAIVDERGLITPWPFSPSVDVWLMADGRLACPSELERVEQATVGNAPIVRTSFEALGLECRMTAFVAPLDTVPIALCLCEITGAEGRAAPASLVVSVRPYNPETICAINELAYDARQRTFLVDGSPLLYLGTGPTSVLLSDYLHGDVASQLREPARERLGDGTTSVSEPVGLASGAAVFDLDLSGGGATVCFACTLSSGIHPPLARMLPERESIAIAEKSLTERIESWASLLSEGMRIQVPDETYQRAFDINKAYLLLLFDGRTITPGVSTYHMMWFRDAAYLVPALERVGHVDKARDVLDTYPDRQTGDGFFRSHSGEWDSNGQAMYTLAHHYRMTGDDSFIKAMYPSLMRGARWIDENRQLDLASDDPKRGLLPSGISAEHFGMGDVYYWDDFWAVGGLRAAAHVAGDLGFESDRIYLERIASEMWEALESSWSSVEKRLGRLVMPVAPGRDIDSGTIGVIASVYPLDLIEPASEIMANTVAELRDKCFYKDTLYHAILHCGLNAYLSLQIAQYYLKLRDPYGLTIFDSLASMATDTFTFPEAINPLTMGGAYGDGHHGWAVSEFVNFLRNMLLVEEGGRLVLMALSKREWFSAGNMIKVEDAPTYFGEVSYSVECGEEAVTFNLPGAFERPPASIELNVPFDIASAEIDGSPVDLEPGARLLEVTPGTGTVVITPARS
jgi:hypothetical protein